MFISCNEHVCDITLPEQAAVDFPPQPPPLTNGDEFPSPPPKSGLIFPPAPPPLRNQGGSPPAPPPLRNGGDFPPAPPAPPVRSGEDFPPPSPLLFEGGVEFLPGRSNGNLKFYIMRRFFVQYTLVITVNQPRNRYNQQAK